MVGKFKLLTSATIVLMVTACITSSGVLQLGPDTYSVLVGGGRGPNSLVDAHRLALKEAKEFCTGMGKELLVTNTKKSGDVEIIFRCLNKGDPELVRPVYRDAPDTVIEDRRSKEIR